jgi:peptidoglycan/xylan/chitin deacetylase (PgdA/CDA1 family)
MKENSISLSFHHAISRVLHAYADWRIKPTAEEKHCYKKSDTILLTFDDYGLDEDVISVLNTLKNKKVKAMFFIQGDWAEKNQGLVERMSDDGHIVGNHTYSHPDLLALSDQDVLKQIRQGLSGPWFRPPSGRYNERIRRLAAQGNRAICYWTIDSQDWTGASVRSIRHTILSELKPGSVILFHLHARQTPGLLDGLIDEIKNRGYALTSFEEDWSPNQ